MAPNEIISAIEYCSSAHDKETSKRAYEKLLDAVGNNHAGTYGPDAVKLVGLLLPVLEVGSPWVQYTALEVLIELRGSFEPEPPSLIINGTALQSIVRQRITELEAVVASIAASGSVAAPSAQTLLDLIHDTPA